MALPCANQRQRTAELERLKLDVFLTAFLYEQAQSSTRPQGNGRCIQYR